MADYEDFLSLDPPNFFMAELLTAISELEFSHQKYKHEYENEERRAIEEKTKERNDAVSFLIIGSDAHSMAHDAVQLLIRKLEEVVRRLERVDNQLTISADEHMLIISFSGSNAGRPNQLKRQCQQHIDYLADEVSEVISARSVIHEQTMFGFGRAYQHLAQNDVDSAGNTDGFEEMDLASSFVKRVDGISKAIDEFIAATADLTLS